MNQVLKERGLLISVDGFDGAGKTTFIQLLKKKLEKEFPQQKIFDTKEPNLKLKFYKKINKLISDSFIASYEPEFVKLNNFVYKKINKRFSPQDDVKGLLFLAGRLHHWNKIIVPALKKNFLVIIDRFMDSTIAYQSSSTSNWRFWYQVQIDLMKKRPDLSLIFDVSYENALIRIKQSSWWEIKYRTIKSHFFKNFKNRINNLSYNKTKYQHISEVYRSIAKEPNSNAILINANESQKQVFNKAWILVKKLINSKLNL